VSTWPWVAAATALAGCHRTPDPRERALALLPGAAQLVGAADGAALADPAVRRVVDVARPRVAAELGCVIDAALAADAVAVAATRTTGVAIVIATRSAPRCPALSRIDDELYLATIGDATVAPAEEASVLAVSRWTRARSYLLDAPLALAIDLGGPHVVAAARPDPFEAWAAIDAPAGQLPAIEAAARRLDPKLQVTTRDGQLVVHADQPDLVAALLDVVDPPPPARVRVGFDCPRGATCSDGTHFTVRSLADTLRDMIADGEPVVAAGSVIGVRLVREPGLVLHAGDIVLGIDGTPVRSSAELREAIGKARTRAAVAVRRGGADLVLVLTESNE
jgi:hypothetical protein